MCLLVKPAPPDGGDVSKATVDNKHTAKKQSDVKVADKDSGVVTTKVSQHSAPGPHGLNSQTAPNHGNVKASGGGSASRNHARRPEPKATHKRKRGLDDDCPPFKRIAGETRAFARPKVCEETFVPLYTSC